MSAPTYPGLEVVVIETAQPDQALVIAVLRALCGLPWNASAMEQARAAIAAVHEHEVCSRCGIQLVPPALCAECASDRTPVVQTERRHG
jgi:hypothetical protein